MLCLPRLRPLQRMQACSTAEVCALLVKSLATLAERQRHQRACAADSAARVHRRMQRKRGAAAGFGGGHVGLDQLVWQSACLHALVGL
jgi:hypothetical protein